MTSTANNTVLVPEKLREAIAESEVPAIAKAPYVQGKKFNTDLPNRMAMLIGAQQVTEPIITIMN